MSRYMLIMYGGGQEDWESLAAWDPADMQAMIDYMRALTKEIEDAGELVATEGLSGPANAFVVTANGDEPPVVKDGPFAESKEVIAGYWLVDVASKERAIEIARKASASPGPDGQVVNQPIEVHLVTGAPDVDERTLAPYKK